MKVIIGLGNPEKKYLNTYHNLGFMAADVLCEGLGLEYRSKSALRCYLAQGVVDGEKVVIVKPTTYMNLSGECVRLVKNYFSVENKDILVIYDDLDIEIGALRVRPYGSPGTHNGMRNISLNLKADDFPRVRIGTKPKNNLIPIIDYVLSKINEDEYDSLNKAISGAAACARDFIKGHTFDDLMQKYNRRPE